MEREPFYSPPATKNQLGIYPKNQRLPVAPEFIFQLWSFSPSSIFPSLRKQLQVIYFQGSGFIFYKHF